MDISLDITVDKTKEIPSSQGFWMDLSDGDEDKFLDILEDEDTKKYFKQSIKNLRWLANGIDDFIDWY